MVGSQRFVIVRGTNFEQQALLSWMWIGVCVCVCACVYVCFYLHDSMRMSEISQRRRLEIVCKAFHSRLDFFCKYRGDRVLTPIYDTVRRQFYVTFML